MSSRLFSSPLVVVAVLSILAFPGILQAQRAGQSMSVQTGRVIAATPVNLESEAGRGALVGGIFGYAATSNRRSSSRRARNTILGAAAGAAVARSAEGNLNGMKYTVETAPGAHTVVVTDQTEVRVGDCVTVEQAGSGTANVRRVSSYLCDAVAANTVDDEIEAELSRSADLCLAAKERLLDAETDQEIDAAIRRVHILCDD